MNIVQKLLCPLLNRWKDYEPRGRGNRAARRAIATQLGKEHLRFASEEIYTERPYILRRGHALLLVDEFPELRSRINKE